MACQITPSDLQSLQKLLSDGLRPEGFVKQAYKYLKSLDPEVDIDAYSDLLYNEYEAYIFDKYKDQILEDDSVFTALLDGYTASKFLKLLERELDIDVNSIEKEEPTNIRQEADQESDQPEVTKQVIINEDGSVEFVSPDYGDWGARKESLYLDLLKKYYKIFPGKGGMMNKTFRKRFYNYVFFNAKDMIVYDRKTAAVRIETFRKVLKEELGGKAEQIALIQGVQNNTELLELLESTPELMGVYDLLVMNQAFDSLVDHNYRKIFEFDEASNKWGITEQETTVRQGYNTNDNMERAFTTMMSISMTHLESTPVMTWNEEEGHYEVGTKYLNKYQIYRFLDKHFRNVPPDEESIREKFNDLRHDNDSEVAASLWVRFFAEDRYPDTRMKPSKLFDGRGVEEVFSMTHVAKQNPKHYTNVGQATHKIRAEHILNNIMSSFITVQKQQYVSSEKGVQNVPTHGTATADQLKKYSTRYLSERKERYTTGLDINWDNKTKTGTLKFFGESYKIEGTETQLRPIRLSPDNNLSMDQYRSLLNAMGFSVNNIGIPNFTDTFISKNGSQYFDELIGTAAYILHANNSTKVENGRTFIDDAGFNTGLVEKVLKDEKDTEETLGYSPIEYKPSAILFQEFDYIANFVDKHYDIEKPDVTNNAAGDQVSTYAPGSPEYKLDMRIQQMHKKGIASNSVFVNNVLFNGQYKFTENPFYNLDAYDGVSHKKLTDKKSFEFDFLGLFARSVVNSRFTTAKINYLVFSDKSKIPVAEVEREYGYLPVTSSGELDEDSLYQEYEDSVGSYYSQVEAKMLEAWKHVAKTLPDNYDVEGILRATNSQELYDAVEAAQIEVNDVMSSDMIMNYDYINREGYVGIRSDLNEIIKIHKNPARLKEFLEFQKKEFIENITKKDKVIPGQPRGRNLNFKIDNENYQDINKSISERFSVKSSEWKKGNVVSEDGTKINPLVEGYFWHHITLAHNISTIGHGNVFQYKGGGIEVLPQYDQTSDEDTFSLAKRVSSLSAKNNKGEANEEILTMREDFSDFEYTPKQKDALLKVSKLINANQEDYFLLAGYAGTGKTTITENIVNYAISQGKKVKITAPTNKAVTVLKDKFETKLKGNAEFETIYRTLAWKPSTRRNVPDEFRGGDLSNTVLIVDEASMMNSDVLQSIIKSAKSTTQIIFLGDSFQLPPVNSNKDPKLFSWNRTEFKRENSIELTEVKRIDESSGILNVVTALRTSKSLIAPPGNSKDGAFRLQEYQQMKANWLDQVEAGDDVVFAVYKNKTRVTLNNDARERKFGVRSENHLLAGDKIIAISNGNNFVNGETFDLNQKVEFIGEPISVRLIDNKYPMKGLTTLYKVVITVKEINPVTGKEEDIRTPFIFSPDIIKPSLIPRNDLYSPQVQKMKGNEKLFSWMKEGWGKEVFGDREKADVITYGYALTTHKSQGSQWKHVYVDPESTQDPRWVYTALTRASEKVTLASSSNYNTVTWDRIHELAREGANSAELESTNAKEDKKLEDSPITHEIDLSEQQQNALLTGSMDMFVELDEKLIGIPKGQTGIVNVGGRLFAVTHKGSLYANEAGAREELVTRLGNPLIHKSFPANPLLEAGMKPEDKSGNRKKDIAMAGISTQYIGDGITKSSTNIYKDAWGRRANTGKYDSNDIVMISANGPWSAEMSVIESNFNKTYVPLLNKLIEAKGTVVVGNAKGGDQLVRKYLEDNGYTKYPSDDKFDFYVSRDKTHIGNVALSAITIPTEIEFKSDNIEKIERGDKVTTVRSTSQSNKIGIPVGESRITKIGSKHYVVHNRGELTIEEAGGKEVMLKSEGIDVDTDGNYKTKYKQTKTWLEDTENKNRLHVYDIEPYFGPVPEIKSEQIVNAGNVVIESWLDNKEKLNVYTTIPYEEGMFDRKNTISKEEYYNKLNQNIHYSYLDQSKRASLGTSHFYQPVLATLDENGRLLEPTRNLPEKSKIAYFNDIETGKDTLTKPGSILEDDLADRRILSSGRLLAQEIYDGAFWILPIELIKLQNSYGGEYSQLNSDIIKDITTHYDDIRGSVRHEKKATYQITNELVRMSRGNGRLDFEVLVRKMLSDPSVSFEATDITLPNGNVLSGVTNMWQIFQELGGFDSDTSWNDLVEVEYLNPKIANRYVGKIGINTSVKTGQTKTNKNLYQVIENDSPLEVAEVKNDFSGIQLNPNHTPDHVQDNLSMISQMIKSAVLEGKSTRDAHEVLEALKILTDYNLNKQLLQNDAYANDLKAFVKDVMKDSTRTLDYFDSFVDKINDDSYNLSYNDRLVVKKMYQQVTSAISKIGIKHKFKGGQFVVTPVTNIVMIYDVDTGKGIVPMTKPVLDEYLEKNPNAVVSKPRNLQWMKYYHRSQVDEKGNPLELMQTPEWRELREAYDEDPNGDRHENALEAYYTLLDTGEWTGEPAEVLLPSIFRKDFGIKQGDNLADFMLFDELSPESNRVYQKLEKNLISSRNARIQDAYKLYEDALEEEQKANPGKLAQNLNEVAKVNAAFQRYKSLKASPNAIDAETRKQLLIDTKRKVDELHMGLSGLVARIPGSGKQSWNAFKVVGFMDKLSNAIGLPVESMVVKGEDFDIDKGNVQFFEIMGSKNNRISGERFPWWIETEDGRILKNSVENGRLLSKEEIPDNLRYSNDEDVLKAITEAYPESSVYDWYESGVKNYVTAKMMKIGLDGRNAIEANTPVSTEYLANKAKVRLPRMWMSPWNALSVPVMKMEQMAGKGMVGFEANALKTYATIYHAVMVAKELGVKTFDPNFEFTFFDKLSEDNTLMKTYTSIANTEDMGALMEKAWMHYSELVNSAADNAKLLILGKVNINENTSNMVNGLVSIGVPFDIIIDFLNNPHVLDLIDFIIEYDGIMDEDRIQAKIKDMKKSVDANLSDIDKQVLDKFMSAYTLGQEFALMAQFLGLSKGLPSDPYRFNQYEYVVNQGVNGIRKRLLAGGIKGEFNIHKFINDKRYRDKISSSFEEIKIAINVPHLLASNPDIMSQLKTYAVAKDVLNTVSSVPILTNRLYNEGNAGMGGKLEDRYNIAMDFTYKFIVDQYLQTQGKIKLETAQYNLSKIDQRTSFLKDFPAYINLLKKKYNNEFINALLEEDIQVKFSDSRVPIVRMRDSRAMSEDMKTELRVAFSAIRDLPDGENIIRALHTYSLLINGGGMNVYSFTQFFDNDSQRVYNDFLNTVNLDRQMKMGILVRSMKESNPGTFKEYEGYEDMDGRFVSGLDNMVSEIREKIADNSDEKSMVYYGKVKSKGKYTYYKISTIGPQLNSQDIKTLRNADPVELLGIPYVFNPDGDIKEANIRFGYMNQEDIGPKIYEYDPNVRGKSLFGGIIENFTNKRSEEDPMIRNNNVTKNIDGSNGEQVTFENTLEGFEKQFALAFFKDSATAPVLYVSSDPRDVHNKNIQVRRTLFDMAYENMFNKGERIILSNSTRETVSGIKPVNRTLLLEGTSDIIMAGYELTLSNKKKIFVISPESYLENEKKITSIRKALKNSSDTEGLRIFNSQFNVFGEDIMYGYAVTPDFVIPSDTILFDEVSLMKNPNIEERNDIYQDIFQKAKNHVIIRSNRFFKNIETVPHTTLSKFNALTNARIESKVLDEVANNFVSAVNDADLEIRAKIVSVSDFNDLGFGQEFKDKKSFVVDNVIYIVRDNMTIDSPIHEFSHLWVRAMKKLDPDLHKKITRRLVQHPEAEAVKAQYPEIADNEDLLGEEILSTLISKKAILDSNLPTQGDYNEYLNWINEQLVDIFQDSELRNMSDLPIGYLAYKIMTATKNPKFFNLGETGKGLLSDYYEDYNLDRKLQDFKNKSIREGEYRIICKNK